MMEAIMLRTHDTTYACAWSEVRSIASWWWSLARGGPSGTVLSVHDTPREVPVPVHAWTSFLVLSCPNQ